MKLHWWLIQSLCSTSCKFQKNIEDSSSFYGGKVENMKIQLYIVKWMDIHVFGATSWPGCSNYPLKKTSLDYKEVWGSKASDTLHWNFYVAELVKDMKLMCKYGRFHSTKFLTNSKKVLEAIPAYDRRKVQLWKSISADRNSIRSPLEYRCIYIQSEHEGKTKDKKGMLSTLQRLP